MSHENDLFALKYNWIGQQLGIDVIDPSNKPALDSFAQSNLNVSNMAQKVTVLGSGNRSALWVQGCHFNCYGCLAPMYQPFDKANVMNVGQVIEDLYFDGMTGLTLSGGEPMFQASALANVIQGLRKRVPDLDVLCYTGFTLEQLQAKEEVLQASTLLTVLDVLIDGPYIANLNSDRGIRGSTNQRVHILNPDYLVDESFFTDGIREVDARITFSHRGISIHQIGVPSSTQLISLYNLMDSAPKYSSTGDGIGI